MLQDSDSKDYKLWVWYGKEGSPYPLIGESLLIIMGLYLSFGLRERKKKEKKREKKVTSTGMYINTYESSVPASGQLTWTLSLLAAAEQRYPLPGPTRVCVMFML